MSVSFIEEERVREQLKHLHEDDAKRRNGNKNVLKRDRQLAMSGSSGNARSWSIPTYSHRQLLITKPKPKPPLGAKKLTGDKLLNNLNNSLQNYKAFINNSNKASTSINGASTSKKQLHDVKKNMPFVGKPIPRPATVTNKTIPYTKSNSSPPPITKKKSNTANKTTKSSIIPLNVQNTSTNNSNKYTNPSLKKPSIASKPAPRVNNKATISSHSANASRSFASKPLAPLKNAKTTTKRQEPLKGNLSSIKKNLANKQQSSSIFSNGQKSEAAKVKPRVPVQRKNLKQEFSFDETIEQIGKVKALVEQIRALNKDEEESISKPRSSKQSKNSKASEKNVSKSKQSNGTRETRRESPSRSTEMKKKASTSEKTKKSKDKDLQKANRKEKPQLYDMKGFFGNRREEYFGVFSTDDDTDDESLLYYTDDSGSDYTLHNDDDYYSSSEADSDAFAKCFLEGEMDDYDETDDTDYKLPDDHVEDLVIHKGTAAIRDLKREENHLFGSDDDDVSKIVEIPQKSRALKKLPSRYQKEELMKLTVYKAAASSSAIRKRHLALKFEDNDLQSQKSIPKLNLEKEQDLSKEEDPRRGSPDDRNVEVKEENTMKAGSCPLLTTCSNETYVEKDFGIPTILSAAPKFDIFKSQPLNTSDSEEKCPELVPVQEDNYHSSTDDDDMESVESVDINTKYLYNADDDLDSSDDDRKAPPIRVGYIDATQCSYEAFKHQKDHEDVTQADLIKETENNYKNLENEQQSQESEVFVYVPKGFDNSSKFSPLSYENDVEMKDLESPEPSNSSSSSQNENISKENVSTEPSNSSNPSQNENISEEKDSTKPDEDILTKPIFDGPSDDNNETKAKKICVEDLLENNVNKCIMYAVKVNKSLKRVELGDLDFQMVTDLPEEAGTGNNDDDDDENEKHEKSSSSSEGSVEKSDEEDESSDEDEDEEIEIDREERKSGLANSTDVAPPSIDKGKVLESNVPKAKQEYLNIHMNSLVSRKVLMLLKHSIYIYGTVKVNVLVGQIEVFGYKASAGDTLEIFSPKGFSLIKIMPLFRENYQEDVKNLEARLATVKDYFTPLDLRNMKRFYVPKTDAIIELFANDERLNLTRNFKMFMNEKVFPSILSVTSKPPFGGSEHLLKCKILPQADQVIEIPSEWHRFVVQPTSRIIVAGGKGVGKSTYVRYLINVNLKRFPKILLIDLDIGQPEIFVPQTVSFTVIKTPLLGPGFFYSKQPHKAYVVGHSNVVMCPLIYKLAIRDLIRECHVNPYLKNLPWIVNTMGYNKGFGLELMAMIAELVMPTDVVQIDSKREINNFDEDLTHINLSKQMGRFIDDINPDKTREIMEYELHKFHSVTSHQIRKFNKDWTMSSKDMRYAMLIARLSEALYGEARMLTDCKPLWINFNKIKLYNAVTNNQSKYELLKACEGSLVFCGSYVDERKPIECYGIGVVRAIDFQTDKLYLIPALPVQYMNYVNCLVIGEITLPSCMFKDQGLNVQREVPFVFETNDGEASRAIKQIFHRPSEFLLGTKRSFED